MALNTVLVGSALVATSSGQDESARATVFRIPIEGIVDLGMAPFVSRVIAEAEATAGSLILLDVNTFGGRVDAAVMIRDALIDTEIRTVAFVNPRAISAGALISLACETIAMAPGGSIGAVTPVTGGGTEKPEAADEKMLSYMRTEMRSTAERRGRRGDVAEAMVDRDVEIEHVSEKGKLLTLTTADAERLGFVDFVAEDLDAVFARLDIADPQIAERVMNWAEIAARGISNPMVSSFLLSIGFLGLMLELYQPGWGIPGTLGLACLATFFFGHNVVQLAGVEEILLFVLGLVLIALELLVVPGGIAGLAGVVLVLVSLAMSLVGLDLRVSWDIGLFREAGQKIAGALLMSTAGGVLLLRTLPATSLGRRLILQRSLSTDDGYTAHGTEEPQGAPVGATGVAISDLRPAGKVRLAERRWDAVSEGGFVKAGTPVRVVAWRAGTPVVRPIETADSGDDEGGSPP